MKNTQQGFSLLELLLVLAVIAALGVAAFLIYPRVQAGRSASSTAQVLSGAQASVGAIFTNGNYSKLDSSVAYNADVFPESMKGATAGTFSNEWDGPVTIFGSNADGTANATSGRFMTITYADVPANVCKKLVPAAAANFGRVEVGTTVVVDQYAATPVALDEAAVITACGTGTTPVDLEFIAR